MKKHIISILERSLSTFLFAFLGLITATNLSDPTALKAAAIAGGLSVAAYLKTVAGAYLNSTSVQTASAPSAADYAGLVRAAEEAYQEAQNTSHKAAAPSPVAVDPVPAPTPLPVSPVAVDPVPAP